MHERQYTNYEYHDYRRGGFLALMLVRRLLDDGTRTLPQSSYGVQKVIGELLVGKGVEVGQKSCRFGLNLRVNCGRLRHGMTREKTKSRKHA